MCICNSIGLDWIEFDCSEENCCETRNSAVEMGS